MQILNGVVYIPDACGLTPSFGECSAFTDTDGTDVVISNRVVFRIVSILEAEAARNNIDLNEWLKGTLFKGEFGG
jgi:hypothetical protein